MENHSQSSSSTHVLIIEDEPIIAAFLFEMLLDTGMTADIADNVADALQLVETRSFDLLFVDLGLPDRSGLEVIDIVQRSNPLLPIVVSTGFGDSVLRDSMLSERNLYLLEKPYTPSHVSEVLSKCGFG